MDPTALFTQIVEDFEDLNDAARDPEVEEKNAEEKQEVSHKLRTLAKWLDDGGFPPDMEKALEDAGYERIP
jgi:hypothetical protein